MKVVIKIGSDTRIFENKNSIVIGGTQDCDIIMPEFSGNDSVKLLYSEKYNGYVLSNTNETENILCNNALFTKAIAPASFTITFKNSSAAIKVAISSNDSQYSENLLQENAKEKVQQACKNALAQIDTNDVFNNDIEKSRVAIIKEIGLKISELTSAIKTCSAAKLIVNVVIVILAIASSFGVTNFLLGLQISNSSSSLKLTTNFGFLICMTLITLCICLMLRYGICSVLGRDQIKKVNGSNFVQKYSVGISVAFMFVIYAINLFYYKLIPNFTGAAFFIALLFVGVLTVATIASGYFEFQSKLLKHQLVNTEYREDFEAVMKAYRLLISKYINNMSTNKINNVKNLLLNAQMKMVFEIFIGILTAPFLAYGVSNTLASCFPEAANWVRISGLRFSPIFLTLATFLIIFAFFSFVKAFTIGKQIKGSQTIKLDGFHDYISHGVTIFGLDSMRTHEKEKNAVLIIACSIILIECTMNITYFLTELGGDIQGMFLSVVTALVPTALLLAETHMLSETMYKIHTSEELLLKLD